MRGALVLIPAVLLVLSGCGSDDDERAPAALTATGPIALTATEFTHVAQSATCSVVGADVGVAIAAIGASDQPGLCGYLQRGEDKRNARAITIVLVRGALGSATVTQGDYPIVTNPTGTETQFAVLAAVTQNDAQCGTATEAFAESGTVTVTSTAGGRLQGSVNVALAGGGAITGTFDAPRCDVQIEGDVCTGEIDVPQTTCVD